MNIDFNNVRISAINAFNGLIGNLNEKLRGSGYIEVHKDEIEAYIESLRSSLVGIGATYEPDNDDFKCVLNDNVTIAEFAPEE